MSKKTKIIILSAILALFIIGTGIAGTAYYYLLYPQFHPQKTAYIYIDRDDTVDSIYNKVQAAGHPGSMKGFRWMVKYRKFDNAQIHTGKYKVQKKDNVYHVFSRIYRGFQEPVNLTIGSVRTLDRLARSVSNQLMIDSAEVAARLLDPAVQEKLGYTPETMACMFIPETYQVYWNITPDEFIERMQKEHNRFWNEQRLAQATAIGLTPAQVSTLASIVEEETNNAAEKPMVAGLYINRLHTNMPLQADPTIKFAVQNFALRRITNDLLRVNSPYNTYLNTGLPPGPIRIPTPQGIDSVLNYTKHNYLYMCAKEDFSGTHNFASNLTDHMVNAHKYWKALNERKIYN